MNGIRISTASPYSWLNRHKQELHIHLVSPVHQPLSNKRLDRLCQRRWANTSIWQFDIPKLLVLMREIQKGVKRKARHDQIYQGHLLLSKPPIVANLRYMESETCNKLSRYDFMITSNLWNLKYDGIMKLYKPIASSKNRRVKINMNSQWCRY